MAPDARITVTLTPAQHWSTRGVRDRRMALWGGFFLVTQAGRVWFAGDTGFGDGSIFREIRARHGAPDVALIPIGSYAPRWFMAAQLADPEDAMKIFQSLEARDALGLHWGTFRLTDEPREEPPAKLEAALAVSGVSPARFRPSRPGAVYDF